MIYFDHNATSPMLPEARQAWLDATEKFIGNPSSPHRIGSRADVALTDAHEKLAGILGCDALDIVWTSGATESNNAVLHHFARALDTKAEAWISAIEHPCVMDSARHYFPRRLRLIPVTHDGVVDLDWFTHEIADKRPGLVAIMAANNETGVLQPWREALAICREWEVPFFCDAVQWLGKLPAKGLGECDFLSGAAHKFGGPRGVGFLKCPSQGRVHPLLLGGKQEEGRRAGTENLAGALSMMAALEARETALKSVKMDNGGWGMEPMRNAFEKRLLSALPGSEIVGAKVPRLWNTVSALMPAGARTAMSARSNPSRERPNHEAKADHADMAVRAPALAQQRWVVKLDKLGFAVSTGSACSSGKEEPSHVLAAMGFNASEASRVLRFSSGWETHADEWDSLATALAEVYTDAQPVKARNVA